MEYSCILVSLRKHRDLMKAFCFIEAEHQIHILYSLSRCTFYKIVDRAHHNDTFGSRVNLEVDIYVVAALYTFCLRAYILVENTDECFICIIFIISGSYFFIRNFFLQRAYAVTRIPLFIGIRCGVKLIRTSLPHAYPS